jgi:hypothetical protein
MEAYSLNHPLIPGKPLSHGEHKKTMTIFIVVLAIAAALSLWYLWAVSHRAASTQTSDPQAALRSKVAELLRQAPVRASQKEIDQVTVLLSKPRTSSVQESETVANLLRDH